MKSNRVENTSGIIQETPNIQHTECQRSRRRNTVAIDATFKGNRSPESVAQALDIVLALRTSSNALEIMVKIHDDSILEFLFGKLDSY